MVPDALGSGIAARKQFSQRLITGFRRVGIEVKKGTNIPCFEHRLY